MGIRSSKSDPGLGLSFPGQREPYSRKTQTEYVEFIYAFLFRFAFVATIFLLAVLIAYLAR
jgi:hypothetical protein